MSLFDPNGHCSLALAKRARGTPDRLLSCYLPYYNTVRTHLSLDKDAPIQRLAQTVGRIKALPLLGGLHHQYVRI
jgi:hypothetical protein